MNDLRSLIPPAAPHSERAPLKIGDTAPLQSALSDKPAIVAFLRHIGCPFAEKTFRDLRKFAEKHGDTYQYIAITHGTENDTDDWIKKVGGDENMKVISDPDREIYGQWVNPRKTRLTLGSWEVRMVTLDGMEQFIFCMDSGERRGNYEPSYKGESVG
jgi:hypothetical protein